MIRRPKRVLGVDPGLKSLGAVLLVDGRIKAVHQTVDDAASSGKRAIHRWMAEYRAVLDEHNPDVVGIEDFEHQPWKTNGKLPRGGATLCRLIALMRDEAVERGIAVFVGSPSLQSSYDDEELRMALASHVGGKRHVTRHAMSALVQAFNAERKGRAAWNAYMTRMRSDGS